MERVTKSANIREQNHSLLEHVPLLTAEKLEEINQEFHTHIMSILSEEADVSTHDSLEIDAEKNAARNLLINEIEQAELRYAHRSTVEPSEEGGTIKRFVTRRPDGRHADERFCVERDHEGNFVRAVCVTDFGSEGVELRHRFTVTQAEIIVENERYFHQETTWEQAIGSDEVAQLQRFSNVMTNSMVRYDERTPEENERADEAALAIQQRLGRAAMASY